MSATSLTHTANPRVRPAESHTASLERDLAATLALAAYSFTVAVGFARVFSGWGFLADLGLLVVVGHGLSFVLRRTRVRAWLAIPAMTVGLLWVLAWYQYRATFTAIFPLRPTWQQFRLDVGVVRDQFQTAVAPVIYEVGWAALAGLAMVLVIVMADAFAFRAEARGEALVPGGVLFVFIAALGSPRERVGATVLLIGVGIVTVVALRALHDRSRRVELTTDRRPSWVLPASVGAAALIALLAGWVGPRLPGADAEPLFETRGRGGGVTEVVSPLVDIRSRLVNQGNVELFRVNADAEAYWRVTTLPEFDGSTFRLPRRDLTEIDGDEPTSTGGSEIRQQYQILSLGGPLLPAAADPIAVLPNDEIQFNADTSTLLKSTDLEPEELFTVVSRTPDITPEVLNASTTSDPPDEVFLGLPDDFPQDVGDLAAEVTAGATTDYARVLALQNWFQSFTYSTEVQAGHGTSAIENFLEIRTGYCEQFAATMAAMARTLGIPSRVAVGYTPGILRSDGWYSVLGKNSHAWPEIWFDDVGWVAFEPTPSRGIPGATDYTGLAPDQDTTPIDPSNVSDARPLPATPTTVFRPPTTNAPFNPSDPDATPTPPTGDAQPVQSLEAGSTPWWPFVLVLLVAAACVAPTIVRRWRSRARRRHATPARVSAAWRRACRDVHRAGVDAQPSMTTHEWAAATAHQLPVAARPMASLAQLVDRIEYSRPGTFDADDASHGSVGNDCELWASQIGRIAVDTLPATRKATRHFTEWN